MFFISFQFLSHPEDYTMCQSKSDKRKNTKKRTSSTPSSASSLSSPSSFRFPVATDNGKGFGRGLTASPYCGCQWNILVKCPTSKKLAYINISYFLHSNKTNIRKLKRQFGISLLFKQLIFCNNFQEPQVLTTE